MATRRDLSMGTISDKKTRGWLLTLVRWLVLFPIAFCMWLHLLGTGSPIPLFTRETLLHPSQVKAVTKEHLMLADGTVRKLPYIQMIPANSPLFQAAVAEGVEVATDGEITGLLWVGRICGNDPYYWHKSRINLTDLAAAIDPEQIDPSVPREALEVIKECRLDPHRDSPERFNAYSKGHVRQFRKLIDLYLRNESQID